MPHRCPHTWNDGRCTGTLEYMPPDEPWCNEHYMCNHCNSTYNTWFVDAMTFYCEENGKGGFFCEQQCEKCKDDYKKYIDAV